MRLRSNLQIRKRPRPAASVNPSTSAISGHAQKVASTPTIHQHHNRHTAQPVIITARLVPLLAIATRKPDRTIRLIQRRVHQADQ